MLFDYIEKNKNLVVLFRIMFGLLNFGFVVWNVIFLKVKSDLILFFCNLIFFKIYDDFGVCVWKILEVNYVFYILVCEVLWDYFCLIR